MKKQQNPASPYLYPFRIKPATLIITYILFAVSSYLVFYYMLAVKIGFIAFIWPVYMLLVVGLNITPSSIWVHIFILVFILIIWLPYIFGVRRKSLEIAILPPLLHFANLLSGLIWGYSFFPRQ